MECRVFDEQVVRHDPEIGALMERFVLVRLVKANGIDLTQFEFDFDLTFAVFLMNPDGTIYGRYGTRSSQQDAARDVSLEGFRKAMEGALELHRDYPANRALLERKRGSPARFKSPEDFPALAGKYKGTLDYEGKVVQSCMHCHQLREAERQFHRARGEPMPALVLRTWPMPDVIGLKLDVKERATVSRVAPGSAAERSGFKPGDQLLALDGQSLISMADVQWVLQNTSDEARLKAHVMRGKKRVEVTLALPAGWRQAADFSWRATTWDLRRMATGGLVLKSLTGAELAQAKLASSALGLRVDYVGEYGDHAVGKKAGFVKNDVLVKVDGKSPSMTEADLIEMLLQTRRKGDKVPVTVMRNGGSVDLELLMQ